jgi:integrase/recombinase XerD
LPPTRYICLRDVAQLARFLHAEDPAYEVPANPFQASKGRSLLYTYAPQEIGRFIAATRRFRESYPLRRQGYVTMLGLIAATGLRLSEALDLRLADVLPEGVLQIRRTKFGKSRLVPLHPTTLTALEQCPRRREAVAPHFVALATYLGHTDIAHMYSYLEATPELMTDPGHRRSTNR